jgi:PAS domain S-box-containing protein
MPATGLTGTPWINSSVVNLQQSAARTTDLQLTRPRSLVYLRGFSAKARGLSGKTLTAAVDVDRRAESATSEFTLRGREVSCFALQYIFHEVERRGQPIEPLVRDLPYSLAHLRDPRERVDWQTLCTFAERCERLWDERGIVELGERSPLSPLVRWMTFVARALFTQTEYYRFALREFCRRFACIEPLLQEIGPGRLHCHLYMREGYEPCLPLFKALSGAFRVMPTLLGNKPAEVSLELLPTGAVFDVRLSAELGGRLAWLRQRLTWPFAARWAARELRDTHGILHERYLELVRKDAALRESERSLRALMEQASDGIVISDPDFAILDANARACDWFGYAREQLLGRHASDLLDPESSGDSWTALLGAVPAAPLETVVAHRDGRARPVEIQSTRLDDGRVLWIMRDISIRKRLEDDRKRYQEELEVQLELQAADLRRTHSKSQELQRRLMDAERLRAAEDLAGSLAHSINNPLAALIGTLQMAREARGGDAHATRQALRLAQRIKRIVAQTLQLFQQGSLEVKSECPRALLHDVREELVKRAQERGVQIRIDASGSLPTLQVDRALISTALVAIAENGIDAMPSGGTLTLSAAALPGLPVVEIRIADEGIGIPPELRSRVFEPFYTTKGGGTGLGLAIAHGIVHGHGGRIQILDRPGGGTVVSVELRTEREVREEG